MSKISETVAPARVSRREFLISASALSTGAATVLAGADHAQASETEEVADYHEAPSDGALGMPPEVDPPEKTAYACDVLVIGSGFAGMHAAMAAKEAGKSVVVVDKGRPGYSGCSPFAHSTSYFDPEIDNKPSVLRVLQYLGQYVVNLDQFEYILDRTKDAFERNEAWGITGGYLMPPAAGYNGGVYEDGDQVKEYFQKYALGHDRHSRVTELFDENGIEWVSDTMITTLATVDGRIAGAVGFHVKSSTMMTFAAKAVILCTGPGTIKNSGYANGGNTFDGEYMAYNLGLTLVGQEFDDFHQSSSYAPGDYFYSDPWDYSEPLACDQAFMKIEDTDEAAIAYTIKKGNSQILKRIKSTIGGIDPNDGTGLKDLSYSIKGEVTEDTDPRVKYMAELGGSFGHNREHDTYGVSAGMNAHQCSGVFCGWDEHDGKTPYPGLYVAGDSIEGDMLLGAGYSIPFTSHGCSVQGHVAGVAAAAYVEDVELAPVPQDQYDAAVQEIETFKMNELGFDPNWAVEYLNSIMISPLVHINPSEASLQGALVQVEYLRDTVVPRLVARTGHDVRIALETRRKVWHAEAKLRAKLFRQESRGLHYRSDYPFRDDENFLCHIGLCKGEDGSFVCSKIEIPDSWKGDLDKEYTLRYPWFYPGEEEALGLTSESTQA